jgi:uncharacterized SAM-binding protein YcdF (DUF218 family)
MEFWATKLAGALLMPPLSLLLLAALGLLLARLWRRVGLGLAAVSVAGLWLLATPMVGGSLLALVEPRQAPDVNVLKDAQAIVVLGGGTYFDAPEYGGDTVGSVTLERLRWGARLHRETGLPVLVTGGQPFGNATSEGAQMKDALSRDLQVPVRWLEERAGNTLESARFSRDILAQDGVTRIALVTHASHMRRAHRMFEQAGFTVLDAPTAFSGTGPVTALSFLPSAHGLMQSRIFCHEALGLGWYHVRRLLRGKD